MADPKGDKLYVNIGASQARRRLKGFGHGVRKVQSAGRNQAVIIHSARGKHLLELQAQFADVGFSYFQNQLQEPIDNLPNLGKTSAQWLREAGVLTIADLERLGPQAAFQLVQARQTGVPESLLWGLAAGLLGKKPDELTDAERQQIRAGK